MLMGMSYAEFWDGDAEMARAYAQTYQLRKDTRNELMWQMGQYVFSAVAAALYGRKAPYPEQPYPTGTAMSRQRDEQRRAKKEEAAQQAAMIYLQQWAENKKHQSEVTANGGS